MQAQRYNELAQQSYNRIPVYRDVLADLDTPLSAYLKLAAEPYSFLFESVHGARNGAVTPLLVLVRARCCVPRGNTSPFRVTAN